MKTKRRSPHRKQPKGVVKGTTAQLAILRLLRRYEVLPSTYMVAGYGKPQGAERLITLLNHNDYIEVVPGSTRHSKVYNRPRVYQLTQKGEQLLGATESWRESDHFKHKFLRCVAQFSFDLAPKEVPGLRLLTLDDILARPQSPARTRAARNPSSFSVAGHEVRPDANLFGFEYRGRYFYLHGFEIDRGTETRTPGTESGYRRKNITRMIRAYTAYVAHGQFRALYGISNVSIAIICTNASSLRSIVHVLDRECESTQVKDRFLFTTIPDFSGPDPFLPPSAHLFTRDWERWDGSRFNIQRFLKGGDS